VTHHAGQLQFIRRRVRVVDDLSDSADTLALVLESIGQEVHKAYNGEDAIAAAEKLNPDLILLDIVMPGLDGYEACRRIRGQSWGQDICIIALTGWGQEEARVRSLQAGFDDHLVKLVSVDALRKLLRSLPRRRVPGGPMAQTGAV
jgi:DNA-binding response OmpR family regulator